MCCHNTLAEGEEFPFGPDKNSCDGPWFMFVAWAGFLVEVSLSVPPGQELETAWLD